MAAYGICICCTEFLEPIHFQVATNLTSVYQNYDKIHIIWYEQTWWIYPWLKAHKFQRSFQDGEDGYFHFKGLSKKPVKALSFPYLCEPSYFEKQFMMSTQGGMDIYTCGITGYRSLLNLPRWFMVKEIVERRKYLFLPKMGLLGSQTGNEKKCWLWIISKFWGLFFHVSMGKFFSNFFYIVGSALKSCLIQKWFFFFNLGIIFLG